MTAFDPTTQMTMARPLPNGHDVPAKATPEQARAAGEHFEAMFLGQMLQHMMAGLEPDPVFGGGHGESVFRSLLIDEYGKEIAKRGGIGIADAVSREILRLQEVK